MVDYKHITFEQAFQMQLEMKKELMFDFSSERPIKLVAGADISYNKGENLMYGIIVILSYPLLKPVAYSAAKEISNFPYKPGYLGFKEVPTLLKAWQQITEKPDVVILDGQGILHPRRMGVASHFGVLTKSATIGCAKNSLYGNSAELGKEKLTSTIVYDGTEPIGYALRTKVNNKPIFVSPGYGFSLPRSLSFVQSCIKNYRMPEPTRFAHEYANNYRIGKLQDGFHLIHQDLELF